MVLARRSGALLLAALIATPSAGFDGLEQLVRRVPDAALAAPSGFLFDFISPDALRRTGIDVAMQFGGYDFAPAVFDPGPARELTGIDFGTLDGVLQVGELPDAVAMLAGADLDPTAAAAVLAGRGFARSQEGDLTVMARGEDHAPDLSARDLADPFGRGLGMAERIALGPGAATVASSWPVLRAALARPAALGEVLAEMVRAAEASTRAGSTAYQAAGFSIAAFGAGDPLPALDPAGALDRLRLPPLPEQTMPAYAVAILIASFHPDQEVAQIALLYADAAAAEAGMAEIERRLALWPEERMVRTAMRTRVTPAAAGGAIGVVSVLFTAAPTGAARGEFQRWMQGIATRDFPVLQLLP